MEGDSVHLRLHRKRTEVLGMMHRPVKILIFVLISVLLPALAGADPGDADKGKGSFLTHPSSISNYDTGTCQGRHGND